tara:strand:- start:497 stop:976 length:480 start_codon:yes stop_codon:yes gene_type:complete
MIIELDIVGITDPRQGIAIKDAVENAFHTLMPRREKPIYINVEVGLEEDMGMAVGYMHEEDDDEFNIIVSQDILNDIEELIVTVTHECIHIKQYLRKELKDLSVDRKAWKGQVWDTRTEKYTDCPWEIEAYMLQLPVANKVLKEYEKIWHSNQTAAAQQ